MRRHCGQGQGSRWARVAAEWRITIQRQPNGFSQSTSYPTRGDLPGDVRQALLDWLTGESR